MHQPVRATSAEGHGAAPGRPGTSRSPGSLVIPPRGALGAQGGSWRSPDSISTARGAPSPGRGKAFIQASGKRSPRSERAQQAEEALGR